MHIEGKVMILDFVLHLISFHMKHMDGGGMILLKFQVDFVN